MSALGQQRTSQVCKQKDRLTGGLSEIQFVSGHTASAAAFFFRRQPSRPLRQQGPAQQHASAFDRVRRALRNLRMHSASAVFCIVACSSGERQAQASSRASLKRVTVSGSKCTASLPIINHTSVAVSIGTGFARERDHSLTIGWPLPDLLLPAVRIYRKWFTID